MASSKISTFDEVAHTAQLVSAGLDEQAAAELSAKIARLHAEGIAAGFTGEHAGVRYVLASCDAAKFSPVLLDEV